MKLSENRTLVVTVNGTIVDAIKAAKKHFYDMNKYYPDTLILSKKYYELVECQYRYESMARRDLQMNILQSESEEGFTLENYAVKDIAQ
jgi:hypothetical protein